MQNLPEGSQDSGINLSDQQIEYNALLNNMDRLGNIIGTMGVTLVFTATDEVEEILRREKEHTISAYVDAQMNYEVASTLANVNWLYVLAVSLFYYTSFERQQQLYETVDPANDWSEERIRGRELVTTGDMFKILGYLLAARGFDMIADSTLHEEQQLTPPP